MDWPKNPTCHDKDSYAKRFFPATWRPPQKYDGGPYKETFRTCWYCGSIHPEDLVRELQKGAELSGSDWKYGWPHKFYVDGILNPIKGQTVCIGSSYEGGVSTPIYGLAPVSCRAKWYNQHLNDEGYNDKSLSLLLKLLSQHSGIQWQQDEKGKIYYQAPRFGYQRVSRQIEKLLLRGNQRE